MDTQYIAMLSQSNNYLICVCLLVSGGRVAGVLKLEADLIAVTVLSAVLCTAKKCDIIVYCFEKPSSKLSGVVH